MAAHSGHWRRMIGVKLIGPDLLTRPLQPLREHAAGSLYLCCRTILSSHVSDIDLSIAGFGLCHQAPVRLVQCLQLIEQDSYPHDIRIDCLDLA